MTNTTTLTPSRRITDEVTSWPGIEAGPGRRGEFAFKLGRHEVGHLHGDRSAHFFFPKDVWRELARQGRIVEHPVFPGKEGPAARRIRSDADVDDATSSPPTATPRSPGSAGSPPRRRRSQWRSRWSSSCVPAASRIR